MKKLSKIQTINLNISRILSVAVLFVLIAVVPHYIHNQWITGPLVNAVLILTCVLIGPMEAVIFGLAPSTVALASGLLPMPLAPMIPFIMIGNAVLVATFYYIGFKKQDTKNKVQNSRFFLALIVAAFLKFIFLNQTVNLLMSTILVDKFVSKLAVMMSWPQFFTAIIGGIMAFGVLKGLKKISND